MKESLKRAVKKVIWLVNLVFSERLFIYASSLSFNVIFILIPVSFLLFSVGSIFLDIRKDLVNQILELVHEQVPFIEPFVRKNITILVARSKLLGAASIVVLLWTASRLFLNFRVILFEIFGVEEPEAKILYKAKEVASVGIFTVLILLFFLVNSLTLSIRIAVKHLPLSFLTVPATGELIYLIDTFIFVLFIYVSVLGRKVPTYSLLYGSFLSTIFLEIMKLLYKYFILYAWKGKTIYGSLWIFFAFFIWLYYSILGFVAGSEIASIRRGHR